MRVLCRVLSVFAEGSRSQISCGVYVRRRLYSTCLINRLKETPNSRVKAMLDIEENTTFRSFDFSWPAVVGSLKSCSSSKAQLVLEWRLEKMLKDNERDHNQYSELIYLCGELYDISLAMKVFTSMESMGITSSSDVFNSLITACFSSGNELTAISLFEIMVNSENYKPNSETYNIFISMHSKNGNSKASQAWASAKTVAGFTADLQSYESLISCCVKVRDFEGADKYFEEMISSGILPNVHILEKQLYRHCERRIVGKVNEFLNFVLSNGWEMTVPMAESLVSMYIEMGNTEQFEELLETLSASNLSPEVLSHIHCGIIKMHAMGDRLDDVEYCVGRMLKRGMSLKLADDVEMIICPYFRRSAYDRLALLLEHIKRSYRFTRSTYELLVGVYQKAGMLEKLDLVLKDVDLAVP